MPCKHCKSAGNYIKKVDTSKPYEIEGKYCMARVVDTVIGQDSSIIAFNVLDRRTGNGSNGGVLTFVKGMDTVKVIYEGWSGYAKLPSGNYTIYATSYSLDLLPLKLKRIELKPNTKMNANIYLGSILQW